MKKGLLIILMFCMLCSFVSATSFDFIPKEYSSNSYLKAEVIENVGELENYTINYYNAFWDGTYTTEWSEEFDSVTNSIINISRPVKNWNISINLVGDEPEMELPVKVKQKVIDKFNRKQSGVTKIRTKIPIGHKKKEVHFGTTSLIINFTEENTLSNNSINDVFIYDLTTDSVDYTTWYNDTSSSWWQTINDSKHPILWSKLESISGGTAPSEIGVNGTYNIPTPPTIIPMKFNNGTNYSNGNQRIVYDLTSDPIDFNQPYTFEYWWQPSADIINADYQIEQYNYGLQNALGTTTGWTFATFNNNGFRVYRAGTSYYLYNATIDATANEKIHIAVVIDRTASNGNTLELYFDNVLVGSSNTALNDLSAYNGNYLVIGHYYDAQTLASNWGPIDNIKLYDYAKRDFSDRFSEDSADRSETFPTKSYLLAHDLGYSIIDADTNNLWYDSIESKKVQALAKDGEVFVDDETNFINKSYIGDTFTGTLQREDYTTIDTDTYYWHNGSGICKQYSELDFTYNCELYKTQVTINDMDANGYVITNGGVNTKVMNGSFTVLEFINHNVSALTIADNGQTAFFATYNNKIEEYDLVAKTYLRSWDSELPSLKFTTMDFGSLLVGTETEGAFLLDIDAQVFTPCVFPFTVYQVEPTEIKVNWTTVTDGDPSSHCTNCPYALGEMAQSGFNTTTITISDVDQWYNITGMEEGHAHEVGFKNNYTFIINRTGLYKWSYSISFGGGGNSLYAVGIGVNGEVTEHSQANRVIGTGGDVGNMGSSGIDPFEAGDEITLMVKDTENPAQDISIDTANFNLFKLDIQNPDGYKLQYSTDNVTWTNFKYVYPDKGFGSAPGLKNNTLYYLRANNNTCLYTYSTINTPPYGEGGNEMGIALMLGIGMVGFLILMLHKNIDETHWLFRIFIMIALPIIFVLMGSIGMQLGIGETYENTARGFYNFSLWFLRVFYTYLFIAFGYKILSSMKAKKEAGR